MDILAKIVESTKARVGREKAQIPFNEMREKAQSLYKNQLKLLESSVDSMIKPPFAFEKALDSRRDLSVDSKALYLRSQKGFTIKGHYRGGFPIPPNRAGL